MLLQSYTLLFSAPLICFTLVKNSTPLKEIVAFIQRFLENKGLSVLSSSLFNKIILFINAVVVVRWISPSDYGAIAFAFAIVSFFLPIVGLGSYQGLLRFGALLPSSKEKDQLSIYAFSRGFIYSLLVAVGIVTLSPFLTFKLPQAESILMVFSLRYLGWFLLEDRKSHYRAHNQNQTFAFIENIYSLCFILLSFGLTYLYKANGYVAAIVLAPFLAYLILILKGFHRRKFNWTLSSSFRFPHFWQFSILTAFSTTLTQLILVIDLFFLGYFFSDSSQLALYKVSSMIPFNLLFLPLVFMKADFTTLAKNHSNKQFLKNYYFSFLKLFGFVGLTMLICSFTLGDYLMPLIFGQQYTDASLFKLLIVAVFFSMILRTPLGGLLTAIGKAKQNSIIALITLVIGIGLNLYLIPLYGAKGAAYATIFSFFLSGTLSLGYFLNYLKKLQ